MRARWRFFIAVVMPLLVAAFGPAVLAAPPEPEQAPTDQAIQAVCKGAARTASSMVLARRLMAGSSRRAPCQQPLQMRLVAS